MEGIVISLLAEETTVVILKCQKSFSNNKKSVNKTHPSFS